MNFQQAVQPRSSANGFNCYRDMGTQLESKLLSGKPFSNSGVSESLSRDRLVYVSTCLIGQSVEVHVKSGSILSGIFHATNAEKDFGIVLKMARVTKDGSLKGPKNVLDTVKRPQTVIIPARELVQVIAKDVSLTGNSFSNGHTCEKRQDFMIDSAISQSHRVEERELERWAPDEDNPNCPELENIFDSNWNRNWDQFETNKALFGVKSTFDEELYTTKLERGPRMWELEREAARIAREIEGAETEDLHLAEERGAHLDEDFDFDEESRFSAVYRGVDDENYGKTESIPMDAHNTETFGGLAPVATSSFHDISDQASSRCLQMDEETLSQISAVKATDNPGFIDQSRKLPSSCVSNDFPLLGDENRVEGNQIISMDQGKNFNDEHEEAVVFEGVQLSNSGERGPSPHMEKSSFDKGSLTSTATVYSLSCVQEENDAAVESSGSVGSSKVSIVSQPFISHPRSGSSASPGGSSNTGGPGLSPSSSTGSLTSEKSKLNPYAKEFKFNPNAKSFAPSSSLRPHSPVTEGSFYYAANVSAVPHMHGVTVSGIGSSFGGHQPVVYNPQAVQMPSPQAYIHPGGPLYGQQQMILGQPRPVLYMPTYPPEMPYKGRDF